MATINGLRLYPEGAIQDIASAIRLVNGGTSTYKLSQMPAAISRLTSGAGDKSILVSFCTNNTFMGYYSLLSSTILTVTRIRPYAFFFSQIGSAASSSIFSFPLVSWIGTSAFAGTAAWPTNSIYFPVCEYVGSQRFSGAYGSPSNITNLYFPECTYIGSGAFGGMSWLSSLSFPKLKYIESHAFEYIYAANNNRSASILNFPECSYIGSQAFNGFHYVNYLSFPKLKYADSQRFVGIGKSIDGTLSYSMPILEYIGSSCFSSTYLQVISFPNCTTIESGAFRSCTKATLVSLPLAVSIHSGAFASCSSLSTAYLPKLKILEDSLFIRCINLQQIDLGVASLITGGSNFGSCYNLLSIFIRTPSLCTLSDVNAFRSTPISTYTTSTGGVYGSIYVPASLIDLYKTATNWIRYSSRITSIT